ncbi:sodium:solute symporter family protein [Bacillus sp. DTU_2020_1000418_1_SI_GHA_SEK_038]|uniref:sodium:solute symporter family protein n=1 Tax=Bacillus sp. DTU_2020_1000418_1_SI_GHA_SEK_038 TaxID=3077585 RepID=UPI0028ED82C8|nr:sodium:solute symporter family protein [Bacillus sp. DTU_2020_1000418_1_SI_GHA_SEK_038]WNS76460.1 sodium:solute symporter family protein [Bacillus sp. DTU_2020_1000418_1_SI_GHA_SEK_038]
MGAGIVVIGIVVVYLAIMVYIGYASSKKIENNEDFLVAGRKMGPWLLAGSLAATEVGGGSTLGVVSKAYGDWGLSAFWYVSAMAVAFIILAFIAPLLRRSLVKTVPEFFAKRYGPKNGFITSIIMLLPMVGLTAVQLIASATILSVMTGWDYNLSVVVVTVVVAAYSVMGGMFSVVYTDVVQWVFIVVGMALIIPFALNAGGGFAELTVNVPAEKWNMFDGAGIGTIIALIVMYIASFTVGQEAVQRYYAAKDEKSAKYASIITSIVYAIFAFIPAVIGILMYGMVQNGIIDESIMTERGANYALPLMALEVLPSYVVGILFAALISATMSSASSNLLAAGSIFTNDIYKPYLKKTATDAEQLKMIRWTMVIVCGLSLAIAVFNFADIITLLMFSFTLRAGGAFIPYLIGHIWERATAAGSMTSLILGSITVALAERGIINFFNLDPIYPALIVSAISFYIVSIFTKGTKQNMVKFHEDKEQNMS